MYLLDDPTVSFACELIARESVTPEDAGCQVLMAERLSAVGFECEIMRFEDVDNMWARKGTASPLLVFAGHTDVVPTGPIEDWVTPPFEPTLKDGYLYGRGAADMKGSLAAMITAIEAFLSAHPDHEGSIALLITSDEEGPSINGTRKVIEALQARSEAIDMCVVGEPSSSDSVGDTIKNGRRGSLGCVLTVHGQQGHVAYPQLADNPVHRLAPALAELTAIQWDEGDDFFPATSLQITNIHAGTGADNVIPGDVQVMFNLRFSPLQTSAGIQERIEGVLRAHDLQFDAAWRLSGEPFITPPGQLVNAMQASIEEITGRQSTLSTAGGTSDGRFIAPTGAQVAELGPVNATIHKVNECVAAEDLPVLSQIYQRILEKLLTKNH